MKHLLRGLLLSLIVLPSFAFAAETIKSGEHTLGRKTAPITLVEYADFQCPYCQQQHATLKQLIRKYRGKVNWMYRHYPLPNHPLAQSAAEASECVAYLGGNTAFWGFADALMTQKTFKTSDYALIAKRYDVDAIALNNCMTRKIFEKKVNDQAKGGTKAGVQGTPTVFIVNRKGRNQKTIAGAQPLEQYTAVIDQMLRDLAKPASY